MIRGALSVFIRKHKDESTARLITEALITETINSNYIVFVTHYGTNQTKMPLIYLHVDDQSSKNIIPS